MYVNRSEEGRRSQAERRAATRGALLGAARELFAAEGYSGVSTEALVRRAGVTRGALYHHFPDKRDLFRALVDVFFFFFFVFFFFFFFFCGGGGFWPPPGAPPPTLRSLPVSLIW